MNMSKSGKDCGPVFLLELSETASIYDPGDDVPHIEGLTNVRADNSTQFLDGIQWVLSRLIGLY